MKSRKILVLAFAVSLPILLVLNVGCELDSADSATRNVGVDYSGFYVGNDGNDLVSKQTGRKVKSLNLRQAGSQLEAIDNNNIVFRGSLGRVVSDGGTASAGFTLEGSTTAGQPVTIEGTLSGSGTSGQIRGTWIEPSLYGTVSGQATINPVQTNAPPSDSTNETTNVTSVTISPSSTVTLSGTTTNQMFSATVQGGSGQLTWTLQNSNIGRLDSNSGNPVVYTRTGSGTNRITVTSGDKSASTSIIQP